MFFNYKVVVLFEAFSNDKLQAYIKMNMKWLWLQKYSEHMFPWCTLCTWLPLGSNYVALGGKGLKLLQKQPCPRGEGA
jgi:hypothetical protein